MGAFEFGTTCYKSSITCCKDCKDRYVGCHDKCARYLKEKQEFEETKKKIREQKRLYGKSYK